MELERNSQDSQEVNLYTPAPAGRVESSSPAVLVTVLSRHRLLFSAIVAACLIASSALAFLQLVRYTATAQIEVQDVNEDYLNLRSLDPSLSSQPTTPENFVQTQALILSSAGLLSRVVDRLGLERRPDFLDLSITPTEKLLRKTGAEKLLRAYGNTKAVKLFRGALDLPEAEIFTPEERALRVARQSLKVKTSAQHQIIELNYSNPDPRLAAAFLNDLCNEFLDYSMELRWNGMQRTTNWLTGQLNDFKHRLEASEKELRNYADSQGLVFADEKDNISEDKLRQAQTALSNAEADLALKQSAYEATVNTNPESVPRQDNQVVHDLTVTVAGLQREQRQLALELTPEHPRLKRVQAQLAEARSALDRELTNSIARIRNEFEAARRREALLRGSFENQTRTVAREAAKAAQYNVLRREVESNRQFYHDMLIKLNSAGIASTMRASNGRIIEPARTPLVPSKPDLRIHAGAGVLGGIFFGVLACLLAETRLRAKRPISNPDELRLLLAVPQLGAIPSAPVPAVRWRVRFLPLRNGNSGTQPLLTASSGDAAIGGDLWMKSPRIAESFRMALASILATSDESGLGCRVIMITSAMPYEGKTLTSVSLGIALAQAGKKTVIVDADLRGPGVHKHFQLSNSVGLASILSARERMEYAGIDAAVQPSAVENLFVLPAGKGASDIVRLLYTSQVRQLVECLRERFDYILIDTPPVLAFADARVVGRSADTAVLVVRANRYPFRLSAEAHRTLVSDGIPILGAVLNDWDETSESSGFRYDYAANAREGGGA